jgi:hypothetical protein
VAASALLLPVGSKFTVWLACAASPVRVTVKVIKPPSPIEDVVHAELGALSLSVV